MTRAGSRRQNLKITGRRLDSQAPPLAVDGPSAVGVSGPPGNYMMVGLTFPAPGCWEITGTKPPRTFITAQNMEEAKAAAYANDPQTELVILGLSENAAVTTCGWARRFFDSGGFSGF